MSLATARLATEKAVIRPALPLVHLPGIAEMQMSELRKLAPNVWDFLEDAAERYGRIQEEFFSANMFSNLIERDSVSPIEDLFAIACRLQCEARGINPNPWPDQLPDKTVVWDVGLQIIPEHKVGVYRVDFMLQYHPFPQCQVPQPVVVELDGHAFHDKDKVQRAYEKARDRFLVKEGYRVLHYTGSEVVKDPYKVAFEAIQLAGVLNGEIYDPTNPVGMD